MMFRRLINYILKPYYKYKHKKLLDKRIEELKKRDPFIYK
jgi:hypothetical protein